MDHPNGYVYKEPSTSEEWIDPLMHNNEKIMTNLNIIRGLIPEEKYVIRCKSEGKIGSKDRIWSSHLISSVLQTERNNKNKIQWRIVEICY